MGITSVLVKSSLCIQILLPNTYFSNLMSLGLEIFGSYNLDCIYLFCNCKHVTLVRRPNVRQPLPESGYASIILGWQLALTKKCIFLKNVGFKFF